MGAFSLKENDANVDLSCRIVDTTSGEIVGAVGGSGQSQRRGVRVAGFGGFPALGGGALNVQSADFQSTILGEATLDAVRDAATKLRRLLLTRQ